MADAEVVINVKNAQEAEVHVEPLTTEEEDKADTTKSNPVVEDDSSGTETAVEDDECGVLDKTKSTKRVKKRKVARKKYSLRNSTDSPVIKNLKENAKNKKLEQEIGALKSENLVLKKALEILSDKMIGVEEKFSIQAKEFDEKLQNVTDKKKLETLEESAIISKEYVNTSFNYAIQFYKDTDKICLNRASKLNTTISKRVDTLKSKVDNYSKLVSATHNDDGVSKLGKAIDDMETDIERLSHEIESVKDQMLAAIDSLCEVHVQMDKSMDVSPLKVTQGNSPIVDEPMDALDKPMDVFDSNTNPDPKETYPPQTKLKLNQGHTKSIIFFDSNRRHLDFNRLWKNLQVVPCGDLLALRNMLDNYKLDEFSMIALQVGTNNTDKSDGQKVFADLKSCVLKIKEMAPNAKLVVGELTPRNDERDTEIVVCNALLKSLPGSIDGITLALHQNLRHDEWAFHDDVKHLSKISIAKFAANIKIAFRKAHGVGRRMQNGHGKVLRDNQSSRKNNVNSIANKKVSNKKLKPDGAGLIHALKALLESYN